MAKSVVIRVNGVGPVLFERSRRARHINITIKSIRGIRVAVPYGISYENAEKVVLTYRPWIKRNLARVREVRRRHQNLSKKLVVLNESAARRKLLSRLEELSAKHGLKFRKAFIRNQKTRWGSCSPNNNIYLNIKLAILPRGLRDYVILHELVHTRISNHGRAFWAQLEKFSKNARKKQRRLNEYGLGLA